MKSRGSVPGLKGAGVTLRYGRSVWDLHMGVLETAWKTNQISRKEHMAKEEKQKEPRNHPLHHCLCRTVIRLMKSAFARATVHIDEMKMTNSFLFSPIRTNAPNFTKLDL